LRNMAIYCMLAEYGHILHACGIWPYIACLRNMAVAAKEPVLARPDAQVHLDAKM